MTSRERVLAVFNRQMPDRCPVDFWAVDEVIEKLTKHYNLKSEDDILDMFEVDFQFVSPDETCADRVMEDGTYFDKMGVHRKKVKNEFCTYEEYASSPLGYVESVEDFDSYKYWPDVKNYDWDNYAAKLAVPHQKRMVKLYMGGLFEFAWALRGYEQFMMDMICEPEIAHYIMDKICTFWCEYFECAMKYAGDLVDVAYTYDDIASQSSLLMSPEMLEEFIYPYHRRMNKLIKSYNKPIIYHSCGAVRSVIGSLKDLPIDVLNPLQPLAKDMNFEEIKKEYGDSLLFHGGICIQHTLPQGTPDQVRAAVKSAVATLGKGGGYFMTSAHYIQNDTPIENIAAMFELDLRTL